MSDNHPLDLAALKAMAEDSLSLHESDLAQAVPTLIARLESVDLKCEELRVKRRRSDDLAAHNIDKRAEAMKKIAVAEAKIAQVEALHRTYYVYDDCGHRHKLGDEGVVDAAGIGLTCVHLYDICWECCTRGDEQTVECASEHDHGPGKPMCATTAALKGEHG